MKTGGEHFRTRAQVSGKKLEANRTENARKRGRTTRRRLRVKDDMTKQEALHNLRREARDLVATIEREYVLDPHERALLYQAGIALDLSLQAAEIVAAEGLTVKAANGGCKTHPAVAVHGTRRAPLPPC
jgi:hypothetical protein